METPRILENLSKPLETPQTPLEKSPKCSEIPRNSYKKSKNFSEIPWKIPWKKSHHLTKGQFHRGGWAHLRALRPALESAAAALRGSGALAPGGLRRAQSRASVGWDECGEHPAKQKKGFGWVFWFFGCFFFFFKHVVWWSEDVGGLVGSLRWTPLDLVGWKRTIIDDLESLTQTILLQPWLDIVWNLFWSAPTPSPIFQAPWGTLRATVGFHLHRRLLPLRVENPHGAEAHALGLWTALPALGNSTCKDHGGIGWRTQPRKVEDADSGFLRNGKDTKLWSLYYFWVQIVSSHTNSLVFC